MGGLCFYRLYSAKLFHFIQAITSGQPCDFNALGRDLFQFSTAWNHASNLYPTKPQNDTLVVSRALLSKYTVSHSNYTIKPNTDIVGNLFQAWTRDINQLQMICDLDNTCIGEWRASSEWRFLVVLIFFFQVSILMAS